MLDIRIERTKEPKDKPNVTNLGFGKHFTDHMFIMDYNPTDGWNQARIVPYQPLELNPSSLVFHYGQEMFEGLKAYRAEDDRLLLFRPEENGIRINTTNDRICMPYLPVEDFVEAVKKVVEVDEDWVPKEEGTSLYIRPFVIATDTFLGVRPSETYKFIIILSPVGSYYAEGINPTKIWVEEEYVRAAVGGVGFAKTGGNYAASLRAQLKAKEKGYAQVLWLDAKDRCYIEEVGTSNVFFKIKGKIITPSLSGSILPGITRKSVLELLKDWGYEVEERKISIDEIIGAHKDGTLEEAFGTGTAAVISPIGELRYKEHAMVIHNMETGELSKRIYDEVTGIQQGRKEDKYNWTTKIK